MENPSKKTIPILLFVNDRKQEGSKQPDYMVKIKVGDLLQDGGAGWKKESKGKKYLSLSVDADVFSLACDAKFNSDGSPKPNFDLKSNHDMDKEFNEF